MIDAVKLANRIFRVPSAKGYSEIRDYGATEMVAPIFAAEAFALGLKDLPLK